MCIQVCFSLSKKKTKKEGVLWVCVYTCIYVYLVKKAFLNGMAWPCGSRVILAKAAKHSKDKSNERWRYRDGKLWRLSLSSNSGGNLF